MLLKILLFPDPRLRTVASKVENVNAEIKSLCDNMLETMYESGGIGLAATQVNIHKKIIVIDISPEKNSPLVLINQMHRLHLHILSCLQLCHFLSQTL